MSTTPNPEPVPFTDRRSFLVVLFFLAAAMLIGFAGGVAISDQWNRDIEPVQLMPATCAGEGCPVELAGVRW